MQLFGCVWCMGNLGAGGMFTFGHFVILDLHHLGEGESRRKGAYPDALNMCFDILNNCFYNRKLFMRGFQ